MSKTQELYSGVRKIIADLYGEAMVYDYLPGEVPYPFIVLGEQNNVTNRSNKDYLGGTTYITIHFWHDDWAKRGDIDKAMNEVFKAILKKYEVKAENANMLIINDTTTKVNLLHGVLDVQISY